MRFRYFSPLSVLPVLFFLFLWNNPLKGEDWYSLLSLPHLQIPSHPFLSFSVQKGSRATRPFGESGLEERFTLLYPLGSRWEIVGSGGVLKGDRYFATGEGGVRYRVPFSSPYFRELAVSGVFLREYKGTPVFLARGESYHQVLGMLPRGELVLEKAFAEGRDPIDLHLSLTNSVPVLPFLHLGVEYRGDDLEDLWEKEEAEGGARHFAGGFVAFLFEDQFSVQGGGGKGLTPTGPGTLFSLRFHYIFR